VGLVWLGCLYTKLQTWVRTEWEVDPTDADTPLFWKDTAVTRRSRSRAFSRRTDRVQNPQVPSNTRVSCEGSLVMVIELIVLPPFDRRRSIGATKMDGLPRTPSRRSSRGCSRSPTAPVRRGYPRRGH